MTSRILTCACCTLYICCLCILSVISLISFVVGLVGLGLYIPTKTNYNHYNQNTCNVIAHQYDTCDQTDDSTCYTVIWSVEYLVSSETSDNYIFSTITQTYKTSADALNQLAIYLDQCNYTCYHEKVRVTVVSWDRPASPTPFLIMLIVGLSLAVINSIIIGIIVICRRRQK